MKPKWQSLGRLVNNLHPNTLPVRWCIPSITLLRTYLIVRYGAETFSAIFSTVLLVVFEFARSILIIIINKDFLEEWDSGVPASHSHIQL